MDVFNRRSTQPAGVDRRPNAVVILARALTLLLLLLAGSSGCPRYHAYGSLVASRGADPLLHQMERAIRSRSPEALLAAFSSSCLSGCRGFGFSPQARTGPVVVLAWRQRERPGTLPSDLWGQLALYKHVERAALHFERLSFLGAKAARALVSYYVDGTLGSGARRSDRGTLRLRLRRQADSAWRIDGFAPADMATLVTEPRSWIAGLRLVGHPAGPPPASLAAPGADIGPDLAVADVDGDGDLDVFLPGIGLGRLFRNDGKGRLTPTRALRGASPESLGLRARFGDADGDGDADLFVATRRGDSRLLENRHGAYRVATTPGLTHLGPLRAAAWIDVDGDRRLDLIVAPGRVGEQTSSAPSSRAGAPKAAASGPPKAAAETHKAGARQHTLVWLRNDPVGFRRPAFDFPADLPTPAALCTGDLDADGRVDLVVVPELGPVALLRNQRTGFVRAPLGSDPVLGRACSVTDVDGDGDLDVIVAAVHSSESWKLSMPSFPLPSPFTPNAQALRARLAQLGRGSFWLRNDGAWRFSRRPLASSASLGWDLAVAAEDLDGDGRAEIALGGGFYAPPAARPAAPSPPSPNPRPSRRVSPAPLDALFFTALLPQRLLGKPLSTLMPGARPLGASRGVTLLGHAHQRLADTGAVLGLTAPSGVRGLAWADLDRDGRPELLLRMRSGALLVRSFRAPLGTGRVLTLRLAAKTSPVTGAAVAAQGLDFTALAQTDGGAADRPWAEVRLGLAKAVRADKIVVNWPDGARQVVQDLDTAAAYVLTRDGRVQRSLRRAGPATTGPAIGPARSPAAATGPARSPAAATGPAQSGLIALGLDHLASWPARRASTRRHPARQALPAPRPLRNWFGAAGTVLYLPTRCCPRCARYLRSLDKAAKRWRHRGVRVVVLLPLPAPTPVTPAPVRPAFPHATPPRATSPRPATPRVAARRSNRPATPRPPTWLRAVLQARYRALVLLRPAPPARQPRSSAPRVSPAPFGQILVLDAAGRPRVSFLARQPAALVLEHHLPAQPSR